MLGEPHAIKGQVADAAEISLPPSEASVPPEQWVAYGRTSGGSHYSPLATITPANVGQLEKAWEYRTGDIRNPEVDPKETTYEVTPTMVDGLLYLCMPRHIAIALDPVSGEEQWRYDATVGHNQMRQHQTCRGLTHYRVEANAGRLLLSTYARGQK
jgi:quinoprotein glucose dehydrogenase